MIMILKQDANLAIVAARANKHTADVAYILTNGLLNAGLIKDDTEYYGVSLKECIDGETPLATLIDVIKQTGIERVNDTTYDAFMECIVMGDGDCPECGGEMEIWDCETHEIPSGDRDVPPDYATDWEQLRCPICSHIIEHDYRPDYDQP